MAQKKKDENLRQISGAAGFVHRVVMFITYPFRKPLRCLFFLAALGVVAYFIPILYGVKLEGVYDWYVKLINDVNKQVFAVHEDMRGTDVLAEPEIVPTQRDVRRQMFAKATGRSPQKVDVLTKEAVNVVDIDDVREAMSGQEKYLSQEEPEMIPVAQVVEEVPAVVTKKQTIEVPQFDYAKHYGEFSSLDYLNEPIEIKGEAKVRNANEMVVNDNYLFLYGVYSNPMNERGVRAGVYLKDIVKNQTIRCLVLAYTKDGKIATAECFIDGTDINRLLVAKGYSDLVSAR